MEAPAAAAPPGRPWLRMVGAAALLAVAYLALAPAGLAVAAVEVPVTPVGVAAAIVVSAALAAGAIALAVGVAGLEQPLRGLVTGSRRSAGRIALPVIAVILAQVVAAPLLEGLAFRLGLRGTTSLSGPGPGYGIALLLACLAIVEAPWMEEVCFRGFLFTGLQRRFGFWPAALVSAFAWSAVHREAMVLAAFTVVGVSLAWLRQRTGSVRAGILLHGLWNTFATWSSVGWAPVLPADALLLATLALSRPDWTFGPLPPLRTALAWPNRLARWLCDGLPQRPRLGARSVAAAGLLLLAAYGVETAGRYGRLGVPAQRHALLIGVPAMLLLAGAAASTARRWRPPGALALAGAGGALVDAAARTVTALGGWPGASQVTPAAALLIAWWLWGVSRSAAPVGVRRSAAAASLLYMGSLILLVPTGLWEVPWQSATLLGAAGAMACMGLAATAGEGGARRPVPRLRVELAGRALGVATVVGIAVVSAAIVSIPHPGVLAAGAQAPARPPGSCDPALVVPHAHLGVSGRGVVRSMLAMSSPQSCRPDGGIRIRVRLVAAGGRSLPVGLAGLAPVEVWTSSIGPDPAAGAMRDVRTRSAWCSTDPKPGPYTLTASVAGGSSVTAAAMICGPAPVSPALLRSIPLPPSRDRLALAGPSCYGRNDGLATAAGLVRSFVQERLAATAWAPSAAVDLARFTAAGARGYVTLRPGWEPPGTGMFVIAVYPSHAAARAWRGGPSTLRRARAALVIRRLPAGTRLHVYRDGNLVVFQIAPSAAAVSTLADYLQNATDAQCAP
jgi:membrane protease YdiL (CAAX protease family)